MGDSGKNEDGDVGGIEESDVKSYTFLDALDLGTEIFTMEPLEPFFDADTDFDEDVTLQQAEEHTAELSQRLLDEYEELDIGHMDESMRNTAHRLVQHVLERQMQPSRTKTRDKFVFVMGICSLVLTAFWLGHDPASFHRLYFWKALVLFSMRWVVYRWRKWHYYMFDFCYIANGLMMATLLFFPENVWLFKVNFAYAMGPLLWSILTFRNSLVFHSVDKITSVFLHIYPACASWAVRFHPAQEHAAALRSDPNWDNACFTQLVVLPMGPYLLWAALYYIKIFITSSERIKARGYDTLFKFVTAKPTFYSKVILAAPPSLQPLTYMAFHLAMAATTMAMCMLWWSNEYSCSAFIVFTFVIAVWNGANFYFEVFARRYLRDLGLPAAPAAHKAAHPMAASSGKTKPE